MQFEIGRAIAGLSTSMSTLVLQGLGANQLQKPQLSSQGLVIMRVIYLTLASHGH